MKLILVRHGDAGAYTLPDNERNLSNLGKQQAQQTANWLTQFEIGQVISSPYNRAMQTAQILNRANLPLTICQAITPDDEPALGLSEIGKLVTDEMIANNGTVLVVCHMNIIAKMANLLDEAGIQSFHLAEGRVFELPFVGAGQGIEVGRFVPT